MQLRRGQLHWGQDCLWLAHGAVDVSRGGSGRPLAILTARCGTGAGDVSAAVPPELEVWLLCSEYSEGQRSFESECSGRGDTLNSVSRTATLSFARNDPGRVSTTMCTPSR